MSRAVEEHARTRPIPDVSAAGGPARPGPLPVALTLVSLALLVATVVVLLGARGAEPGSYGLIESVPPVVFALLAAQVLVLLLGLRARVGDGWLVVPFAGLVAGTSSAPALIEELPRFPTAYMHVGFVEYVLRTGDVAQDLDARFNWSGLFTSAAMTLQAVGVSDPVVFLRWAPTVVAALSATALFVVAGSLTRTREARWLVLVLFQAVNWVGQDYFAPQSLGFFLALTVLGLALRYFGRPEDGEAPAQPPAVGVPLLVLAICTAAIAASHQLTPFFLFGGLLALVLVRRLVLRSLPWLVLLVTTAWISLAAQPYWAGHRGYIFGGAGNVTRTMASNVAGRLRGSEEHLQVVQFRVGFTAAVVLLALLCALVEWRRHRTGSLAALALAAAPGWILLVQGYGGEGLLRVFYFSAPFLCVLIARPLSRLVHVPWAFPLLPLGIAATFVALYLARFGNEAFEETEPREMAVLQEMYRTVPQGATLVSVSSNVPWRFEGTAEYDYQFREFGLFAQGVPSPADLSGPNPQGRYLVVTEGAVAYAQEIYGVDEDWGQRFVSAVQQDPRYAQVLADGDNYVFEVVGP